MPPRDAAPGAPCWADLASSDVAGSRSFYGELFGWGSEEPNQEFGGYVNFTKGDALIAGLMQASGDGPANVWSIYLATDDAAKTTETAKEAGAQVIVDPMEVGTLGTMAVLIDPGGAAIGVWQAGDHKGFGLFGEPGTPGWFELHTRDYAPTVAFYENVLHWNTQVASDTPEFRYTMLVKGEEQYAGIMDASAMLPDGVPASWSVYFATDDTDASLAKVQKLGGSVVMPAEDTPYGRLAVAADPAGAVFKLVGPAGSTSS